MSEQRPLEGSCSCGRYKYVVVIPESERGRALLHFRTDNDHRRSQAALLTAFLRVPLMWYSSNTTSFFPDETHTSISRTFSPVDEPHCQRKFCGYCGTHLSYWTEEPQEERDYLHITVGSLRNKDLDTLQDLDLLPDDLVEETEQDPDVTMEDNHEAQTVLTNSSGAMARSVRRGEDTSHSWFEEMLDGSQLGRTRKTRRGVGTSKDGTTTVSWEITEFADQEESEEVSTAGSKRKLEGPSVEGR